MKKHRFYYASKTKICVKNYFKLKYLSIFKRSINLNNTIKQHIMIKTFNINKEFNLNKLRKYCILTGRIRFNIKSNKISRIVFRELSSKGLISGVFKK